MQVFDGYGNRVGKVDFVYMGAVHGQGGGAAADNAPGPKNDSFLADLARAINPTDNIPEEINDQLAYEGFVRVDISHLFASDRYILPSQISQVTDNQVILNVYYDSLAKGS